MIQKQCYSKGIVIVRFLALLIVFWLGVMIGYNSNFYLTEFHQPTYSSIKPFYRSWKESVTSSVESSKSNGVTSHLSQLSGVTSELTRKIGVESREASVGNWYMMRIVSNDLTPHHGENQTYLNTLTILKEERIPPGFRRFWLVNCIWNGTKEKQLIRLLESWGEHYMVLKMSNSTDAKQLYNEALNLNGARNTGIQRLFDLGAKWVVALDGGQFVPEESFPPMQKLFEDDTRNETFHLLPMIRAVYKIPVNSSLNFEKISPNTTGLHECTIAVHRKFLTERTAYSFLKYRGLLYDESRLFAKAERMTLLWLLKRQLSDKVVSCKGAFVGEPRNKVNLKQDLPLVRKCGWSYRLVYFPEPWAPYYQPRKSKRPEAFEELRTNLATLAEKNNSTSSSF